MLKSLKDKAKAAQILENSHDWRKEYDGEEISEAD